MLEGLWQVTYVVLWLLVVLEGLVILALARQVGLLHRRLGHQGARMMNTGLELGDPAPPLRETTLDGRTVTLGAERSKPTLLLFMSPRCPSCEDLASVVPSFFRNEGRDTDIVIISRIAGEAENREFSSQHLFDAVPYVVSAEVADQYQVTSSPYGILIDSEGKIYSKGIVNNLEQLESLLNTLKEGFQSYDHKMNALTAKRNSSSAALD